MNEFLFGLAFSAAVFVPAALLFLWYYHRTVSRPAKLQQFQYRLYALRDRAINLAVDGVMKEDDPRWQGLYKVLNDAAKPASVERMRNGMSFVLALLRAAKPLTPEQLEEFRSMPSATRKVAEDYGQTVLSICWEGSWVLRLAVWAATRFKAVKEWLKQRKPVEVGNYIRFLNSHKLSSQKAVAS